MGFWCCVGSLLSKWSVVLIPILQPIWSNLWNYREKEIENLVKGDTNQNSSVPKEDCCDKCED